MNILIAGASGFIGKQLVKYWQKEHKITVLGRDTKKLERLLPGNKAITWAELEALDPVDFDVVVNLAGETINHLFWTEAVKQRILQSRIQATQALVSFCCKNPNPHPHLHFLNASALSIYGLYDAALPISNTEKTAITLHSEFLCQVASVWEHEAEKLATCQIPLTVLRFAVVLSKEGGALPTLMLPAKLGLAAKLGNGQQPFAWIAIEDLIHAIDWIVSKKMAGAVNMVAPTLPTQDAFSKCLSGSLQRPYFLRVHASILQWVFQQMAREMLLKGQDGTPQALLESGFCFKFNELADFLKPQ